MSYVHHPGQSRPPLTREQHLTSGRRAWVGDMVEDTERH